MRRRVPEGDSAAMTFRTFIQAGAAIRRDRARAAFEQQPDPARATLQRERLDTLVAHATTHSPFYRRWYAEHGVRPGAAISELPVMTKSQLMEHWDDVPTDRTLTLTAARDALQQHDGTVGRHHLFQTGGSTGEPGVFAYDKAATGELLANFFRCPRINGITPRFPRRVAMSVLFAPGTIHMAARLSSLADVGVFRMQRLPVSAPIRELASALQQHRPEVLGGYASTIALLATAQLDGHLDIAPNTVITSSEPLTDAHRERVREAWGVEVFDAYATTETGILAQECAAHQGRHVFEDTVILEVEPDRVLVTNLFNHGFPLIRFAVDDLVTLESGPCPCGRTTARITSIAGRANDILQLPSRVNPAETVAVHPSAWTPITALPAVADADICYDGSGLDVRVVPRSGAPASVSDAMKQADDYVTRTLGQLGLDQVPVRVSAVESLPRTAVGKRQLVRNLSPRG